MSKLKYDEQIEIELAGGALLEGYFRSYDDSFDHEFGTESDKGLELIAWCLRVIIDDIEYEVSRGLSEREQQYFIEKLINEAQDRFSCVVKDGL